MIKDKCSFNCAYRTSFSKNKEEHIMTIKQQEELQKLRTMELDADSMLASLAREAIYSGDVELQMATISTPLMGKRTLQVYMEEAGNSGNAIYPMRLQVAADPTRGDCILSMLAELAVEFADVEMINILRQNPSAGEKTKNALIDTLEM